MSKEDAHSFYELLKTDQAARDELKPAWEHIQNLANKHGYNFSYEEYYDAMHEKTGMTNVGTSNSGDHSDTDTCFCITLSETPRK